MSHPSIAVRLRQMLWQWRLFIAPPNTLRGHIADLAITFLVLSRYEGFGQVGRRVYREFRRRWRGGAPAPLALDYPYPKWIKGHTPRRAELAAQGRRARTFAIQPCLSVLLWDAPSAIPRLWEQTLGSLLVQTYPNWEACLFFTEPLTEPVTRFMKQDQRFHLQAWGRSTTSPECFNQAAQLAQGEWLLWLRPGDCLASHALFEVVARMNAAPAPDIIYCDTDRLAENGKSRREPWFKPDWSPALLLSVNYLEHGFFRRTLVTMLGGADLAFPMAWEWDLSLRCAENTDRIAHLPKVLFHARQRKDEPESAALRAEQARCLAAHGERRRGHRPRVTFPAPGIPRLHWHTSETKVSILIPTKDKPELIRTCLSSLLEKTTYPNYEVILVDNGSAQSETLCYYAELATDPRVRVVPYPERFNYSRANNLGACQSTGDLLLLLNNDVEILDGDWLNELVGWAEQPGVGIVGAKLIRPDGSLQHAGLIMGLAGHGSGIFDGGPSIQAGPFGSSEWYRDYNAVTGACLLVRRAVFEELGGLDETYRIGYSDIDFCLRARALGYRVIYTPFAQLLHHEGGTRGFNLPPADVLRASVKMWATVKAGDSFFNPNLSYAQRLPTLAYPGEERREDRLVRIMRDFGVVGRESLQPEARLVEEALSALAARPAAHGPKHLVLLSHDFSLSGAPLMLLLVARYLVQQGYTVDVISAQDGPMHSKFAELGPAAHPKILPDLFEDGRVAARVVATGDVVIANTIWSWRAIHAAGAFEIPCIWWIHESTYGQNLFRKTKSLAQALASASAVLFPSRATADLYAEFVGGDNFVIVHNGIGPLVVDLEPGAFSRQAGKVYVAHIGSVEKRKGQDTLLQAVAALAPDVSAGMEFFLIGRILEADFYRKIARMARKAKNVHLLGEMPHVKALAYIRDSDVLALTSRDEVLPVTVLEALCLGKAVISTRVGGLTEVITHGENGLLVDAEDVQGMAASLTQLFYDPALLHRLGESARATGATHLSIERFGQDMIRLINRVAQNARSRHKAVM